MITAPLALYNNPFAVKGDSDDSTISNSSIRDTEQTSISGYNTVLRLSQQYV